jgi:AhpD family alkylhydroperoxidase
VKTIGKYLVACSFFLTLSLGAIGAARAQDATLKDIEKTLGTVPSFFKAFPADALDGAWDQMKSLQLNPGTAIPGKYKELIGLAVAAQIPCRYCIYFHTEAAKLNGAADPEVKDALLMAAVTRQWSTVLNGLQIDEAQFRAEAAQILKYLGAPHPKAVTGKVTDAASAYKDMEAVLGVVPTFLRQFPEVAIAGAWREFKTVQLNPKSAIPGKYQQLMGLAVAAQIPCRYCIYFHTEAARLDGASDAEIREAVAMAGLTRHWSTLMNGAQIDEATFKREAADVFARARKTAHR